jgi:hypothetical protein
LLKKIWDFYASRVNYPHEQGKFKNPSRWKV